ncbi:tyrosine-protein phosphatase non-receptor type 14 isoform X2 [Bacillus rossius redtenbacheri]|uniref:tyrosine-protein phosphatase non-receptor type 14 isoform X2 n=1 Tax=Bacillus rossius redtenbacheri TaxID=93214 RepID=UPI002FDDF581
MPFKLRLKKSQQYKVASKSLFVICVELLDGTTMECTLSAESTGKECLDSVCQRLGLQQPEFFGLRYASHHGPPHLRWVDLDQPVKKQLDKHARDLNLFLRVMFYVSGVSLLHDEMTRYHYFLQLKMDVMEGRICCSPKQAVLLASYSMQAEFGDYDLERHTAEYLKDFALFPKHLLRDGIQLENLTEAVICQHAALAGLAQGTAEEYYILAAQQLEGYGQETFIAKDESGVEVIMGVSLSGVIVTYESIQTSRHYRWKDIGSLQVNHKRCLLIVGHRPGDSTQFHFSDPDMAKYVTCMCDSQREFFLQHEQMLEYPGQSSQPVDPTVLFHGFTKDGPLADSREELDTPHPGGGPSAVWSVAPSSTVQRARSTSCLDLSQQNDMERLRALLPSYRPAPDYETAVQQKYHAATRASNSVGVHPAHQVGPAAVLYSSQPENLNSYGHFQHVQEVDQLYEEPQHMTASNGPSQSAVLPAVHAYSAGPEMDPAANHIIQGLQLLHLYKPPPPYPISNSTPDLASQVHAPPRRPNIVSTQVSGSSPDLVSSRNVQHLLSRYLDHPQHVVTPGPAPHHTYTDLVAVLDPPYRPEPIYENVPLAWASQPAGADDLPSARSRASSVQSAPETSRSGARGAEPHELASFSLPFPAAKNKLVPTASADTLISAESPTPSSHQSRRDTGSPASSGSQESGGKRQHKTRRRWALLGGRSKSASKACSKGREEGSEQEGSSHHHRWSTGLPRVPLPPTSSRETMFQLLEKKLVDSQLFYEFEKILKTKPNSDFSTALLPENAVRNRYKDVLPYEENRVRLTPSKENRTGYINASHITATVGSQQRFYIAAQGPLPNTLVSFWQMVWEADVYLMVMLNSLQEEGAVPYCPPPADHRGLELGEFQVWRQFSQETGHCVTTRLRLYHVPSCRMRAVWHLQYSEWGDQGCPPSVGHFLGFLEELSSVRQHTVGEIPPGHNRNPPVLVHCNAGAGRTGVAILCDLLLYTLDHNQELDVPRVVTLLRHQRPLMVQTVAQYRFVYSLLIHYLKQSRLI